MRRFVILLVVACAGLGWGCGSDSNSPADVGTDGLADLLADGLTDATQEIAGDAAPDGIPDMTGDVAPTWELSPIQPWQQQRQEEFLTWACENSLPGDGTTQLMLHLECAKRLGMPAVAAGTFPDDKLDATFDKLYQLKDTSDFDGLRLVNLIYAHYGDPALSAELWQRIEQALFSFKFWYADPTPDREWNGEPVVDNQWYWTENHVLLFRTIEFLMGQRYPQQVFEVTGMTGAEHRERARVVILEWLEERAKWGFTEWHSDVYYNWDLNPLMSLVEWADDPEVAFKAAQVLDLLWLDIALHLHQGNFGATHGRSYIKDKPCAELQDVFDSAKMVFDDTQREFRSTGCAQCAFLARATRYAVPAVTRVIAKWDEPMVDMEHMNVPLDERPPAKWDDPLPPRTDGLVYDDEDMVAFWWSMSAFTTWPLLPLTVEVADRHNLWAGQFKDFKMVGDLIHAAPDQPPMKVIFPVYQEIWPVIGSGLLAEVFTYTYRDAHVMLSTAQDYRPGTMSNQTHAGQATLSEDAVVFVTHPGYLAVPEGAEIPADFNWQDVDEPGPGYWTGNASRPRSAQHGQAVIHLYAPQFPAKVLGQKAFDYREETHAYFPVAHFDQVELAEEHGWIFGRKGEGYVGLWSHLPTAWREGQPEVWKNGGQPFDRVAQGSAQNAWIVQVGSAEEFESFDAFMAACVEGVVEVTAVPDKDDDGFDDGYRVRYLSPTEGLMEFDWHGPLTVDGQSVDLHPAARHQNPFVTSEYASGIYHVTAGTESLLLDFFAGVREL